MSYWLGDIWIQIQDISFVLPLSCSLENHVCLSCGVQVTGVAWQTETRIVSGVGDLVQRTGDGRTGQILSGQAIERSGDAMCGLHRARGDEERGFLGWASKPRLTICQWFDLKTTRIIFSGLASKSVATVFSSLASKSVVGFLVEPQNQGGGGFFRFEPQN
jgi:hypothetical protein